MHMKLRDRTYFTPAKKAELVAAFRRSGLNFREFADQQGIASSNIHRWVQQDRPRVRKAEPMALVEVPNILTTRPGAGVYRLRFPQGLELELPRGFEPEEVRTLVQLLQSR